MSEYDRAVAKAARLNLTVNQLQAMVSLVNIVEDVSGGAVQGLSLSAAGLGSELRMHSFGATYYVSLEGGRLKLVGEIYGRSPLDLMWRDESITAWETASNLILECENYIEPSKSLVNELFDTCQNLKQEIIAHE